MSDDAQETHRHQLLSLLFGSDVPHALEGQLLRTSDVAALFQVSERTVSEWAKRGQIPSVRTPGGHRRYPAEGIRALLEEGREGGSRRDHPERGPDSASTRGSASVTEIKRRRGA
ncbi:MAG TPA: helix-turn-helix domain-containing protein [Acidimicrobiales bacterium]|jgi:excisionase family DNA binding protein